MDISERFGQRLRELREAAGMTQQQLADATGVKLGGLRDIEQGVSKAPRWDTVLALAKALGVDCTAFTQEPEGDTTQRGPGRPRKADDGEEATDQASDDQAPAVPKRGASGKGKK